MEGFWHECPPWCSASCTPYENHVASVALGPTCRREEETRRARSAFLGMVTSDNKHMLRLPMTANQRESMMKSWAGLTRQCSPTLAGVLFSPSPVERRQSEMAAAIRNDRFVCLVKWVALAGENREAFIPTPFKRWHGIRAQPRFSGDSCVKNVV